MIGDKGTLLAVLVVGWVLTWLFRKGEMQRRSLAEEDAMRAQREADEAERCGDANAPEKRARASALREKATRLGAPVARGRWDFVMLILVAIVIAYVAGAVLLHYVFSSVH